MRGRPRQRGAAAKVSGARALVVSSAVDEQNPEVLEARRLAIPVIPRGELLAELMRLKFGIAVAVLAGEPGRLEKMGAAARQFARPGAAGRAAEILIDSGKRNRNNND